MLKEAQFPGARSGESATAAPKIKAEELKKDLKNSESAAVILDRGEAGLKEAAVLDAGAVEKEAPSAGGECTPARCCGRKPSPEKRRRILEEALRLFSKKDYHQVCMDRIAEAAGVGKGTLYRYFPDKEKLFFELLHLAVNSGLAVMEKEMAEEGPAYVKLCRVVVALLDFFRSNEPLLAILSHEKIFRHCCKSRDFYQKRAEMRQRLERLLAAGIAEGSLRADLEPAVCAVMLMASFRGLVRVFGSSRSSEQLAHQLLSIVLDGVLNPRADIDRPPPLVP